MTYENFIERFEKRRPYNRGFMVPCPAHDDNPKTPSLAISRADDGGVLLKCFANCSSKQIVSSLGLTLRDLFAKEPPVKFTPPERNGNTDDSTDIKPVVEKIYSYENEDGFEVFQVLRMKPKTFRQRHRGPDGNWVNSMDGVFRVLYKLPQVLAATSVIICEGEKDVENLSSLGYTATCNVGGAGKWLDGYTESLAGKDVVLCGDNDEPGVKHMKLVFDSIAGTARTVKVLKLPESHKDATDFISAFKLKEDARAALDELVSCAYPHVKGNLLPIYSISEIEDDYKRFVRAMDRNSFSLSRWLPSFSKIRPLVPGELVFIIGDTGAGKTGVAQNISRAVLPLPTLIFELELPKELMFERYAAMTTGFTCDMIERGYRETRDESLKNQLDEKLFNLFMCPEPRLTVAQIENYVLKSELKIGERPKVVVIDYVQLLQAGNTSNRRERISDIAEALKVMAKSTRTIVIVTSQISRPKEVDASWEPSLHSAKESGSIEASCGLLISAWKDLKDGALNLRVLKSSKGGAGLFIKCNFDGARMRITERANVNP